MVWIPRLHLSREKFMHFTVTARAGSRIVPRRHSVGTAGLGPWRVADARHGELAVPCVPARTAGGEAQHGMLACRAILGPCRDGHVTSMTHDTCSSPPASATSASARINHASARLRSYFGNPARPPASCCAACIGRACHPLCATAPLCSQWGGRE